MEKSQQTSDLNDTIDKPPFAFKAQKGGKNYQKNH